MYFGPILFMAFCLWMIWTELKGITVVLQRIAKLLEDQSS